MCGIVGYVGSQQTKNILLDGLLRLEYRGYDSAGYALYNKDKQDVEVRRCLGAVQSLIDATEKDAPVRGQGIAHTRWATHGVPSEVNAHPHRAGLTVLVHNGIIENHAALKAELSAAGAKFESQTDTEVFARLIEHHRVRLTEGDFKKLSVEKKEAIVMDALRTAMGEVHGHYAILFMVLGLEDTIFGVQSGAPMIVGRKGDETILASDLQAILPHTKDVIFVPLNTLFVVGAQAPRFFDAQTAKPVELKIEKIEWSSERVSKEGYAHFMMKEIFEQPLVVADTLSGRLPLTSQEPFVWDHPKAHEALWKNVKKLSLIGCGSAYHAALVAKYFFERWARLPVEVDLASEFRYRHPILDAGTVMGVISQSGETADTLAALRLANDSRVTTFSVCNVPGSTIMRESHFQYPTKAGPEIGVASTKAFTAQLTVLCALARDVAKLRGFELNDESEGAFNALARLPHDMEVVLSRAAEFEALGATLENKKTILFIGRGTMYPIALEGALKLKEITYRHAEGYAAGELKHGPIALVDENLVAIVLSPRDELRAKTLSNLEEIKSRKGTIIGVGEKDDKEFQALCSSYVSMPKVPAALAPMLYVIPLQLISYGLANALKCNIDKPRNLAKSVTVE